MSNANPSPEFMDLPVQTRAAEVRPGSFDAERGKVIVVASTGSTVRRTDFWSGTEYDEQVVIDEAQGLDLARFRTVAPVLDNHNAYGSVLNTLGVVERAWVEQGQLLAELRFDVADERAKAVFEKIGRGIIRAVSIGYDADYVRVRAKDRTDGGAVDLVRTTRLEPYEVSAVMMPADAGAMIRSGDGVKPASPTRRYAVRNREESQMSDPTTPAPAPAPAAVPQIDEAEINRRAMERSRSLVKERTDKIRETESIAQSLALDMGHDDAAKLVDAHTNYERSTVDFAAVKSELLERKVRKQALQASVDPTTPSELGEEHSEKQRKVIIAGMLCRLSGKPAPDNETARYARMNPADIAEARLEARGVKHTTLRDMGNDSRSKALFGRVQVRAHGGMLTTSDFPELAGAVMNARIKQVYKERPQEWAPAGRKVNLPDFRVTPSLGFGNFPPLLDVPEAGVYERGAFTESTYGVRLKKGGRIVSLTWELMLNNNWGSFDRLINDRINACRRYERAQFLKKLLANKMSDGTTDIFSIAHANISAVTGVPSVATLTGGMTALARQKGETNDHPSETDREVAELYEDYLATLPAYWMLGTGDAVTAGQIFSPMYQPSASSSALTPAMQRLANGLILEPVLDDQTPVFSVLFADPNDIAAFQYGWLEETDGPFFEEQDGFEVDGKDFKVVNPFYVDFVDHRGAVKITRS